MKLKGIINSAAAVDVIIEERAIRYVRNHISALLAGTDKKVDFEVYIVKKCKDSLNWQWLIGSTLPDGMYYEVTYNAEKDEWHLETINRRFYKKNI